MTKPYTSHIDTGKLVHPETWVLSLVAKAKGSNPEHAFLVVEGLSEDAKMIIFRRYDFVLADIANAQGVKIAKRHQGLVVVKEKSLSRDNDVETQSRFFWAEIMSDIYCEQRCYGASWGISAPLEADKLHAAILEDRDSPPAYHILGKESLLAASASQTGDNCYSWALNKAQALGNQNINYDVRLRGSITDLIGSKTTKHLSPPQIIEEPEPISPSCRMM